MGIDFTKMFEGLRAGYNVHRQEHGTVKAEDVAKKILWLADKTTVENLTSIFNQAAKQDGNNDLSEAEFEQAINSEDFQELVKEYCDKLSAKTLQAKDLESDMYFGIQKDMDNVKTEISSPGTPRDHVVAEKGEWFANEIWDPMKKLADEALKYMQENNGTLEKFSFTGFPKGVILINLGPSISYSDDSNDIFSIKDGRPDVTRHADSVQARVVFEFQGETYKVLSDGVAENLEPWGNPSYNESDFEAWGAPVEDTTSAITGEPHTEEPDETEPKEKS